MNFFKYISIDPGKVTSTWGKELPVIKTEKNERKIQLEKNGKKLIAKVWRRPK